MEITKEIVDYLAMKLIHASAVEGLFLDTAPGPQQDIENQNLSYRDMLPILTEAVMQEEKGDEVRVKMEQFHDASILADRSGENYIYEILAYGLEAYDFANTDDLFAIIPKMGLSVDDFIASNRLTRGLYKVFRLHYPEKLKRPEYSLLFGKINTEDLEIHEMILRCIAVARKIPQQAVTADDMITVMEDNEEILDLCRELRDYVLLTVTFPKDGEAGKIYLAIGAKGPKRGGTLMSYCNGVYILQQYVIDWVRHKELINDVALIKDSEDAKETARLMFAYSSDSEMTLRIPLSATSYAQTVYPFDDFDICYPEGENGELSSSQRACAFGMRTFFGLMSNEAKKFLRDH